MAVPEVGVEVTDRGISSAIVSTDSILGVPLFVV